MKRLPAQQDIRQYAAELGFSAAYCFAPIPEDGAPEDMQTLVLLIRAYAPGGVLVDHFYPASNAAYHAAGQLVKRLETEYDLRALHLSGLRMKPICRRLAAFGTGRNTLNYLPEIGSRFCMELVGISEQIAPSPITAYPAENLSCGSCTRCMQVCPTGAITPQGFVRERCIRHHMLSGHPMPEEMRRYVGAAQGTKGIVGCDLCQRACPANAQAEKQRTDTDDFTLPELLTCDADTARRFAALYGKNYAIRNRVLAQAVLTAANREASECAALVEGLTHSASETVAEHARWAMEKLKEITKIY